MAGALSMALGEWLSVQSSRELYQHQIGIEKQELATIPEEEVAELSLIYQAKGIPAATAEEMAQRLLSDPATALDTLAREELAVDPRVAGRLGVGSGADVLFPVCDRRADPGSALRLFQRDHGHRRERGRQRSRVVRDRSGHHPDDWPGRALLRAATGGVRHGGGGDHVWHRRADRGEPRRLRRAMMRGKEGASRDWEAPVFSMSRSLARQTSE